MLTPLQYFGPTAALKTVLKCEYDNGDHEDLRNLNELTRQDLNGDDQSLTSLEFVDATQLENDEDSEHEA